MEEIPANAPVALPEADLPGPFQVSGIPRDVYYRGEPARRGVIDLIPEPSFFTGFRFEDRDMPEDSPTQRVLVKGAWGETGRQAHATRTGRVAEVKRILARRGATRHGTFSAPSQRYGHAQNTAHPSSEIRSSNGRKGH